VRSAVGDLLPLLEKVMQTSTPLSILVEAARCLDTQLIVRDGSRGY